MLILSAKRFQLVSIDLLNNLRIDLRRFFAASMNCFRPYLIVTFLDLLIDKDIYFKLGIGRPTDELLHRSAKTC